MVMQWLLYVFIGERKTKGKENGEPKRLKRVEQKIPSGLQSLLFEGRRGQH